MIVPPMARHAVDRRPVGGARHSQHHVQAVVAVAHGPARAVRVPKNVMQAKKEIYLDRSHTVVLARIEPQYSIMRFHSIL